MWFTNVKYMNKLVLYLLVILFLVIFPSLAVFSEDIVTITGSTTVMPLAEKYAEVFNNMDGECQVTVSGGGSGVGIKNVGSGFSDIGIASRNVRPEEKGLYGDNFVKFLIAYDAVCIAVSQPIYDMGITNLTRDQIKAIYNGNITNWKELCGLDEDICAVARMPTSGTRETFSEIVMGDLEAETPGVGINTLVNYEMKTAITGSDKAIGYLGLSYVTDGELQAVAYEGIYPSVENITSGSYSLSRPLYMITWGVPDASEQEFLDFVLSEKGQALAEDMGFIPVL